MSSVVVFAAATPSLAQDVSYACGTTNGQNCVVGIQPPTADHTDGANNSDLTVPFPSSANYVGTSPSSQPAPPPSPDLDRTAGIDIYNVGGQGGDAKNDGDRGGAGGYGGGIHNITVGSGVSVTGTVPGDALASILSQGGVGGSGSHGKFGGGSAGTPGTGGNAGDITVTDPTGTVGFNGTVATTTSDTSTTLALRIKSQGGQGGPGDDGGYGEYASAGGAGGNGNDVTVLLGPASSITSGQAGALIASVGGAGYNGANDKGGFEGTQGGNGGNGGNAGSVTVTLSGGATISAASGYGLSLQATGGNGGNGGAANLSQGGQGGNGGNGGSVLGTINATINGSIAVTSGYGLLAQSFGGNGGNGGNATETGGAAGGTGGTSFAGGAINVSGSGGAISTTGTQPDSIAVLVQSIGGGGGAAGGASAQYTIGGTGGSGADAGTIAVNLGKQISTVAERSGGIVVQSIGGGGGAGGSAQGGGYGSTVTVGGTAGNGGDGNTVYGGNTGTIQTSGAHSSGMIYQSVGGGGGTGGSALGYDISMSWGASVAVGGAGGGGGAGNGVGDTQANRIMNTGAILTTGANSHGFLAQSIGGGGGVGGASVSDAILLAESSDLPLPNLSLNVSLGGTGGSGGGANTVGIGNSGLIVVSGAGASGMVAQSIAGGGGAGGDSKANSTVDAQMASDSFTISANVAIGGSGGGSSTAGTADVQNAGLIIATGESGAGILAQTIGGGGGVGGSGDGNAAIKAGGGTGATDSESTITVGGAVGAGGKGGSAGWGGTTNVSNTGGILTLGDTGYGILAQSIGGGGGAGGGAAATQHGGNLSFTVKTGGSGGAGGLGGNVTVTNSGSIVTFGADATAIYAQSIGGGGGAGGKAASSLGGSKTDNAGGNGNAVTGLQNGLNLGTGALIDPSGNIDPNAAAQVAGKTDMGSLISMANALIGSGAAATGNVANDLASLSSDGGGATDGSSVGSFTLNVAVGGYGGSGGSAIGTVTVVNSGSIGTVGQMSDGIWAQSIGGGGGAAGAASASTSGGGVQLGFAVGGTGGISGNGGVVNVSNTGGSITTTGGLANGVVAQSIGGGGGKGGVAGSKTGLLQGLSVSIGGDGGAAGTGNTVTVDNGGGTILTQSHRSIGIVAQSIGGGGGFVKTLSTDTNTGGGADLTGDTYQIGLTFGGSAGTCMSQGCADGGTVNVFNGSTAGTASAQPGSIVTAGRDAYGIVAQSIGGGGGLMMGGTSAGTSFFGSGFSVGNGGPVTVETLGSIATSGDGAIGILAQSIGGGGGFGGDTAAASNLVAFAGNGLRIGNGGPVTVTVDQGGSVATSGVNAPAIFAQSVGGGGGRVTTAAGAVNGWSGATGGGIGSAVTVNVNGTVAATGSGSHGIYAESTGTNGAGSVITINVGSATNTTASVTGGSGSAAGIFVDGGAWGSITNYGTISAASGISVANTVGTVDVENYGTMAGGTSLTAGSVVHNYQQGTFNATQAVNLGGSGQFVNDGKLIVGGVGRTATVQLDGKFTQTSTGTLVLDVDHVGRTADLLHITQTAVIDGAIKVNPLSLSKTPATVLQADGGLTLAPTLGASPQLAGSHLFSYAASVVGSTLQVAAQPHFRDDNAVLGVTQQAAANYLQRVWDTDDAGRMSGAFLKLANAVGDTAGYAGVLGGLASTAATRVGALQPQASVDFVANMNSCPTLEGPGPAWRERDCVWGRAGASHANVASSGGLAGFGQNRAVLQLGGQKEIADGWFLGGSLAYGSTTQSAGGAITDLDGSTGAAGLVLKREWDRWQFAVAVDGGFGRYDSSRYLGVNGAADITSASFGAQYAGLHGRVAYALPFGDWYLKPYVDAHAIYGHTDGYTEAGTALSMRVKGEGAVRFMVAPMLEAGTRVALGTGPTVRLYAAAGALLASDNGWTADASFVNAPIGAGSFRTQTVLPRQMALVNVGAQVMDSGPWSAKLEYTGAYGDGYQSNAGSLKVEYRF